MSMVKSPYRTRGHKKPRSWFSPSVDFGAVDSLLSIAHDFVTDQLRRKWIDKECTLWLLRDFPAVILQETSSRKTSISEHFCYLFHSIQVTAGELSGTLCSRHPSILRAHAIQCYCKSFTQEDFLPSAFLKLKFFVELLLRLENV